MCGRFTLFSSPEQLAESFDLPEPPILAPRFNIAPTQPVGIVRMEPAGEKRTWALTHWGLIPSWSKDPSMGARMINARAETVPEKPAFRAAFAGFDLLRIGRLSVVPVPDAMWGRIEELADGGK